MSLLDQLEFVKKAPAAVVGRAGASPLDKARKKFLADLDVQIALARDPHFVIRKDVKRRDGTTETKERKPKSWAVVQDGTAYITIRYSNKPVPLGGKRGSVIKCAADQVSTTLTTVREWVASEEADSLIERMMNEAKRKPRAKANKEATPPHAPTPATN